MSRRARRTAALTAAPFDVPAPVPTAVARTSGVDVVVESATTEIDGVYAGLGRPAPLIIGSGTAILIFLAV